eukprot:gene10637-7385_t
MMESKSVEYNKRYSVCSESADLTANDLGQPSLDQIKYIFQCLHHRLFQNHLYVEEVPSPMLMNSDTVGYPGSVDGAEKGLIELQPEHSELNHSSSQPHFNSSSDIIYAAKALRKLKRKWIQEDARDLASSGAKGRNETGGPQLASSDDVTFPLPTSVRTCMVAKRSAPKDGWKNASATEENLIHRPLKAEIKAKAIGNPYAFLDDDDDAEREKLIEAQLAGFYRKALDGFQGRGSQTATVEEPSAVIPEYRSISEPKKAITEPKSKEKQSRKVAFFNDAEITPPAINNLVVPQPPSRIVAVPQKYQRTIAESALQPGELHKKKVSKKVASIFPSMGLHSYGPTRYDSSVRNEDRNDSILSDNSTVQCQTPLRSVDFPTFPQPGEVFSQSSTESEILTSHRLVEASSSDLIPRPRHRSKEMTKDNSSSQHYLHSAWRMPLVGKQDALSMSQNSDRGRDVYGQNQQGGQSLHSEKFPQLPKYLPIPISARIIGLPQRLNSTNRIPQTSRERMRVCEDNMRRTASQTDLLSSEAKRTA